MPNEYLSIPEAAAILGISRIAVFKRVKKGTLPAIRIGRNWAVPAFAVAAPGGRPPPAPPPAPAPAAPPAAPGGDDGGMGEMGWD